MFIQEFSNIIEVLKKLQGRLPLTESVALVENFRRNLSVPYYEKFESVLARNPDYGQIQKISDAINGIGSVGENMAPYEFSIFKHLPIVSVEVERVFSRLNAVLDPHRKKFLVPNLKSVLVLMWNSTESS